MMGFTDKKRLLTLSLGSICMDPLCKAAGEGKAEVCSGGGRGAEGEASGDELFQ